MTAPRHILLTGGTGNLGRALLRRLTADGHTVFLLVRKNSRRGARTWLNEFRKQDAAAAGRVRLLTGDLEQPGIFDESAERAAVVEECEFVVHAGAATHPAVDRRVAYDTNVTGTRSVLDLCKDIRKLQRLLFISCAAVAGDHVGVLREGELLVGQQFDSRMAESKMVAERKVRGAMLDLPITVARLAALVGDSKTGQIERVDGPYHLFLAALRLQRLPKPLRLLPVAPGGHSLRIQAVPLDFAVDALATLLFLDAARGECVALCDPFALTVREWCDLLAERLDLLPLRVSIPAGWTSAVLRSPAASGLRNWLDQGLDLPPEVLLQVATPTTFDTTVAERLLRPLGVRAPHAPDWIDPVLNYAREKLL